MMHFLSQSWAHIHNCHLHGYFPLTALPVIRTHEYVQYPPCPLSYIIFTSMVMHPFFFHSALNPHLIDYHSSLTLKPLPNHTLYPLSWPPFSFPICRSIFHTHLPIPSYSYSYPCPILHMHSSSCILSLYHALFAYCLPTIHPTPPHTHQIFHAHTHHVHVHEAQAQFTFEGGQDI